MSVRTMARVWSQSRHAGSELLMLLAIADFADDDGNAYPAVGTLAQKCRMSDRNANHILVALRASGELEIRLNEGPRGTNRYRITLIEPKGVKSASPPKVPKPLKPASPLTPEERLTPEAGFTLKPVAEGGEAGSSKPLKPASPEPSLNHQEPPRKRASRSSPVVDQIDSKTPKPITRQQLLDEGVSEAVITEFLNLRKAKRAPLTPLAWAGIKTQVTAAGWTLDRALSKCVERGWRSFEAAWVSDRPAAGQARSGTSVLHADDVFAGAK